MLNRARAIIPILLALAWGLLGGAPTPSAQTFGSPNLFISAYKYLNITAAAPTTTVVKSGSGILHTVCINTPAATGTVTIYDNTAASGTKIGTITAFASTNPCFTYDANFSTGLTIVTATAANDVTVTYY